MVCASPQVPVACPDSPGVRANAWSARVNLADWRGSACDRDTQGVARPVDDRRMTIQLDCPWCQDEVAFEVDETADELSCTACGIRTEFAPDPVATYSLLYEAAVPRG